LPAEELQTVSQAFSDALIGCGFPPCPGGVMLRNPAWRGDVASWHARAAQLAHSRDPGRLLEFAILLDARAAAGNHGLFDRIRPELLQAAHDDILLHHFAAAALEFATPLGLFGRLRSHDDRLDIKQGGIFPLVHGLRALALRARLSARNSFDRAQALVEAQVLSDGLGRDVQQALAFFQRLRLDQQLAAIARGETPDNRLQLGALRRLDRELLRDALGVVEAFKAVLRQAFHL
jgi:CBS domain-containing protein